jgi:hypothetical protein
MALIFKQPNPDTIIFKRSLTSRLSGLIWFAAAGLLMFTFKADDRIWLAVPCLFIGLHFLTYTLRINIRLPQRDILWQRRILFLFPDERLVPFSGIRSVRIRIRGKFLKIWHLYFFLVDGSQLSITRSYLPNQLEMQGSGLAQIVGKPLVYEQEERESEE